MRLYFVLPKFKGGKEKMLSGLSNFIIKKYKLIFVSSLIIFIFATLFAINIGMDSNMEGMLPANSKSLQATNEYTQYFDSQDSVLVVVQGEGSLAENYLNQLSQRLYQEGLVNNILYKIDTQDLEDYLHLYIDTKNYRDLENQLENPSSFLSLFLRNKDFLSFSRLFLERFEAANDADKEKLLNSFSKLLSSDSSLTEEEKEYFMGRMLFGHFNHDFNKNEYITSETGETYLMIIKPNIDMENFVIGREVFFNGLSKAIEDTNTLNLAVGITGGAFVQDYEADVTMFDGFLSTALFTFFIIILFVVVSFKRLLLPLTAGYPLLLGAILSTAFAYLMYQNLNLFSISFAVLLLGLGIDFAVHIISRYLEERTNGYDTKKAVENTIKGTSGGMLVGAVTTSIAFLTFLFAEFKAFTQMGVISGVGILLLCLTMLFIVPTTILLFDSNKPQTKQIKASEYAFLKPIGAIIEKRPLVPLITAIVFVVALTGNVLDANIKTDMSKLYPQNMDSLYWLDIVEEEFDYNPTTLTFMVNNLNELKMAVSELSKREDIKNLESILEYLPAEQDYKLEVIGRVNAQLIQETTVNQISPTEIIDSFSSIKQAAVEASINKDSEGYQTITGLVDALQSEHASYTFARLAAGASTLKGEIKELQLSEDDVTIDKLPQDLAANFVGKSGKLSIEVIPNVNIWEKESFTALAEGIEGISGYTPVGMPAIMNEVTAYVQQDMIRISLFCFIALIVILFLLFRSIKDTITTIIPLALTIYITLGIMPILGVDLNIFSIIAFPVLIGIGIDSAVHLLHRIKSSPERDLAYILAHTGKAIMMTTMTTLIGFGSLYFTNHPGLSSFGLVTIIGMALCLILTLTVLPSLYVLLNRRDVAKSAQSE